MTANPTGAALAQAACMSPTPLPKKRPRSRPAAKKADAAALAQLALEEAAKAVSNERPAEALSYVKLAQGFERLAESTLAQNAPENETGIEADLAQELFDLVAKLSWLMLHDPAAAPLAFQAQIADWLVLHAPNTDQTQARAIAKRALQRFLSEDV